MRWLFIFLVTAFLTNQGYLSAQIHQDFAIAHASDKYCCSSLIGKIFLGNNYRREWGTAVEMPIFELNQTSFGIVEMGGGQQTTSLELIDEQNREWALRSVDKQVKPNSKLTENKFVMAIIQDQVSGSYPYAALSVSYIANAAGVPAGDHTLYFVPDDSSFGKYRPAMANKVFILVNRQPQKQKGISTLEMMERLKKDKQCYVDAKEYLKARLVDWLVADWDRHDDQWRWVEKKTDLGIGFYAVPRDRDQAFYRSNGLLTKFVGLFMPHIDKFNKNAKGIKGLSAKSWALDRQFMSSLKKADWEITIKEFQKNVSDSVIVSAIKKQPPEIFTIRGNKMIKRLKSRRDGLLKGVMKYYLFLTQSSG